MQKLSEQYKDDDDVKFVVFQTVFEDRADAPVNTFERLKEVAAKYALTMPFAQSGSREDKSKVMGAYQTRGTPWTVIIDRKGVIRYSDFHIAPEEAAKLIEELKGSMATAASVDTGLRIIPEKSRIGLGSSSRSRSKLSLCECDGEE